VTLARSVKERPPEAVYLDYLQNAKGKSVAAAYSVRAKPGATVSTPLDWRELDEHIDPDAFTIDTVPDRIAAFGDIWGSAMRRRNSATTLRKVVAS
jgi:bifunctional non-homologous end joining protein LigD